MKYFRNLKIAKKMIVLCLSIFLIPLGICYALSIKIVSEEIDRRTLQFAEAFNAQIVASLDHFVQDYEAISVSVLVDNELFNYSDKEDRTTTELVSDYKNMRKVLFRLSMLKPELETASILMRTGDFVQTGAAGIKIEENLIEENWVKDISEQKEYFYLIPAHRTNYWNRRADEVTITFVRKILSSGVRYLGALLIDVNPTAVIDLNDEFESAKTKYGMEISIHDASGRVIYDTRPIVYKEEGEEGFYPFQEFGKDYIVLTGNTERLGLHVLTAIPKASVLLDRRHVHTMMAALAVICSVLIIFLVIPMSHTLTKPLAKLGYGMSRMKNGEYIPIKNYSNSDELGDLIQSYNHMICEMQHLIDRVYVSEIRQKDSEIIALQSQINPHMLFNTLESIRMKALVNGDAEVSKMILILAKMFRTILDSMNQNHVIKDELNYVEKYIELQNLRENGRFKFYHEIEEELLDLRCIPILFQPLVENSIEHGQCNREGKLNIRIIGQRRDDLAVFAVADDGQGMDAESLLKIQDNLRRIREDPFRFLSGGKTGVRTIGMANILTRLRLNDDKNGDVKIAYSNAEGTCIEIWMSINNADPEQ